MCNMRGTDVLLIRSIFIFSKWHSLNMKHRSRAEETRHKSVSWLQSCASLLSLKECPLPMQFTGWAAKHFLSPYPKKCRARCQLKAPRHLCLATQLRSLAHSAQGPAWHGRTPACGNETLKFEQESTGHLGKCWFAYRRKAGWLIWKGTWRFLGVEHVLLCPLTFWTQESITEQLYRLPIILDGFWHEQNLLAHNILCASWILPAAAAAKLLQPCPTLCDPIDGSPPGFPIPGIPQARTLEWVAISFSNVWKGKGKVNSLSHVPLFTTPWTAAYQAPPSMGFSRQEDWSGVPLPSPEYCLLTHFYNWLLKGLLLHRQGAVWQQELHPMISVCSASHKRWPMVSAP